MKELLKCTEDAHVRPEHTYVSVKLTAHYFLYLGEAHQPLLCHKSLSRISVKQSGDLTVFISDVIGSLVQLSALNLYSLVLVERNVFFE